jgi:hypothetical protein
MSRYDITVKFECYHGPYDEGFGGEDYFHKIVAGVEASRAGIDSNALKLLKFTDGRNGTDGELRPITRGSYVVLASVEFATEGGVAEAIDDFHTRLQKAYDDHALNGVFSVVRIAGEGFDFKVRPDGVNDIMFVDGTGGDEVEISRRSGGWMRTRRVVEGPFPDVETAAVVEPEAMAEQRI